MPRTIDPIRSTADFVVYEVTSASGRHRGFDWVVRAGSLEATLAELEDELTTRIAGLQTLIDYPAVADPHPVLDPIVAAADVPAVPTGTLTLAQVTAVVRALRDEAQANRVAVRQLAAVALALRGVAQENRAGAQAAARTVQDLYRLFRGDFG